MKRIKKIIIIVMIIVVGSAPIYGEQQNSSALARFLISSDVGQNIAGDLINGGLLGDNADYSSIMYFAAHGISGGGDTTFNISTNDYATLFNSIFDTNSVRYKQNQNRNQNNYSDKMYNLYKSVLKQMKNNSKLSLYFKDALGDKSYSGNKNYAREYLMEVMYKIIDSEINGILEAYTSQGCTDKKTFTYKGNTYNCSDIEYSDDPDNPLGANNSQVFISGAVNTTSGKTNEFWGNTSDDRREDGAYDPDSAKNKIESELENNPELANIVSNIQGMVNNFLKALEHFDFGKKNERKLEAVEVDNSYQPSFINAAKFSKESNDVGNITVTGDNESFTSYFNNTVKTTILDLSKIGKYIMYSVLIIYGVICIWSGGEGKARFKETLPFLILAIIFFYVAPGLVDIINAIFVQSDNSYEDILKMVFTTFIYIARVASFAGIIFNGLVIMFSNPQERANIKKKTFIMIIGCILVFASTLFVNTIIDAVKDVGIDSKI